MLNLRLADNQTGVGHQVHRRAAQLPDTLAAVGDDTIWSHADHLIEIPARNLAESVTVE